MDITTQNPLNIPLCRAKKQFDVFGCLHTQIQVLDPNYVAKLGYLAKNMAISGPWKLHAQSVRQVGHSSIPISLF